MVIDTPSYDVIIGTCWMHKAHARIDISEGKMQIEQNRQLYLTNLYFN